MRFIKLENGYILNVSAVVIVSSVSPTTGTYTAWLADRGTVQLTPKDYGLFLREIKRVLAEH